MYLGRWRQFLSNHGNHGHHGYVRIIEARWFEKWKDRPRLLSGENGEPEHEATESLPDITEGESCREVDYPCRSETELDETGSPELLTHAEEIATNMVTKQMAMQLF